MGLGLLGAMGGAGDAMVGIGRQMQERNDRSELQKEHFDFLEQKQIAAEKRAQMLEDTRRNSFISGMDSARANKAAPDMANLQSAEDIYKNAEGLSDEDRQAGIGGVNDARSRISKGVKLDGKETALEALKSGVIKGDAYAALVAKDDSSEQKYWDMKRLQEERLEAAAKRATGHDASREKVAEGNQGVRREAIDARYGGGGSRSGTGSRGKKSNGSDYDVDDLVDSYGDNFKVKAPGQMDGDKPVYTTDVAGKNTFRLLMSEAVERGYTGKKLESAAYGAANKIAEIRALSNGDDAVYKRMLHSAINDKPVPEEPGITYLRNQQLPEGQVDSAQLLRDLNPSDPVVKSGNSAEPVNQTRKSEGFGLLTIGRLNHLEELEAKGIISPKEKLELDSLKASKDRQGGGWWKGRATAEDSRS